MKDTADNMSADKQGMGLLVARNSIFGVAQALVSIAVLFLVTQYILKTLGVERFAVWALVCLVTTYGMLSDFGMTKALVYFIPIARIEGGIAKINLMVSTAMSFYLITVTIVMAGLLILRNVIVIYVFKIPDSLYLESLFVVTGAILVFGISILSGVYNSVLFGYQRVDIASFILIGYSILDPLGSYIVLSLGYGLPGMMMSRLVVTILMTAALWTAAHLVAPGLKYNPKLSTRPAFVSIFKYGVNNQVASIAWLLDNSISKILLPALAGLSFVTYYHLAFRIRMRATVLFYGAMGSVTPAAAELYVNKNMERLRSLYFRSLRYLFLFALPLFVLMAVLSQPFVNVSLDDGFELVAMTIILMSFPAFIGLSTRSSNEILRGIGHVCPISVVSVGTVVSHFLVSLILGKIFGYFGVVMGMVFVSSISSFVLIRVCNKHIGVSLIEIPKPLSIGAILLALLLGILAFAAIKLTINMGDLLNLVVVGAGYVVCYLVGIFGLRLLDNMDISLIIKLMPNWMPIKRFFRA